MKNPNNKPLRVVREARILVETTEQSKLRSDTALSVVMLEMMKAQAMLVSAGKDSALPHFIACVKELERIHRFTFEQLPAEPMEEHNVEG